MTDHVFGIDLGTTYSAIARINSLEQPEVLLNYDSSPTTPSVVYFEGEDNVVVGAEAKRSQLADPDNACSLIKRHMGTVYPQEFGGKTYTPEGISSFILKELVSVANSELGVNVSKVAITVPAYFGIQHKESTRTAGQMAGLDVIGIVTEPVAAALSLGIRDEQPQTVLVYDLGGGTFDTTILKAAAGQIEVIAIDGNKTLGGADWDDALAQLVADKFVEQAGLGDENPRLDAEFEIELLTHTEEAKKSLTQKETATVFCSYQGKREIVSVSRADFEAATRHLVAQTIEISQRVLGAAQKKNPGLEVGRVLLVGGSAKMPMIESALREELGWNPESTSFDLAVAKGAAIYAQAVADDPEPVPVPVPPGTEEKLLAGGAKTLSVTNALSRGLGVRFVRGDGTEEYIGFILHANDALPASPPTVEARTIKDGQTSVAIALYEQVGELESENLEDNEPLREHQLPIPSLDKGSLIEVTLTVTAEGAARVTAHDPEGGQSIDVEATVSVLSAEEVAEETERVAGISLRS